MALACSVRRHSQRLSGWMWELSIGSLFYKIRKKNYIFTKTINIFCDTCSYPNSHVPTLEETIVFAKENNLFLLLDIKGTVEQVTLSSTSSDLTTIALTPSQTLPVLVECFRRDQWLSDHAVVTSFFPDVIYSVSIVTA